MDEGAIELSKNKYEIDMCNGTIMDKLVSFAIPLMVSGIPGSSWFYYRFDQCVYQSFYWCFTGS